MTKLLKAIPTPTDGWVCWVAGFGVLVVEACDLFLK